VKEHSVGRLPVTGFGGVGAGIVSMNDIVLNAGRSKVANAEIVETLQAICAQRHPIPRIAAA
jgi:hypothetical protein